jgi:hypothetical protein
MASYTDIIPKFNPYIQQLPVETMAQVGMEKQRRYDEGVQKIQSNIDNIAGLDIVRDVDKNYLQSKLNELGSKLKTVAAGDFSNYQLVNSVGGMAKQIGKDSTVQNAVFSTAKLRKEQQRKEKAIEDGKSSPENEVFFSNQVSEYLNNTEIGKSFNGQYIEYTDVDKKLRELHSKLKEANVSTDNPYIRDNSGNTLYFYKDASGKEVATTDATKGQAKYDLTMLTTTVKGIGAERILNNFYDSLNETDKRQLNITAQYHYRDATPERIQSDIVKTYEEKKKIYSKAIIDATVELQSSKLTPEQKKILENQIKKAKDLVYEGGFDKQMNEELLTVDTEQEASAYRYKTYTQKYLTNLAKDLANETISTEFKNNPGTQALMAQKEFEFTVQKERQRQREWSAEYTLKVRTDRRAEEEAERKRNEDVKLQPIVSAEKIATDFTKYGMFDLDKDIDVADENLTKTTNKLAMLMNPNAKTPKELEDAVISAKKLYEQYRENPNSIDVDDNVKRKLLNQMDIFDDQRYTLLSKRDAAQRAGSVFGNEADAIINKQPGLRIGSNSFSARELYDFEDNSKKYLERYTVRGADGPSTRFRMSDDILTQFKGKKEYPIALALYNSYNKKAMSRDEQTVVNQINNISSNTRKDVKALKEKQIAAQSKAIYDLSPEFQQMNIQINPENKKDINTINQIIGLKTKDYNDRGALDSERPNDFNPSKLAKMEKPSFTYIKKNDGSATLVATSGGDVQKIPLTATEFRNWVTDYSYVNPMTDVISAVQSNVNKTTNKGNGKQGATARYTGFSPLVPGLNNTKIASNVRFDIEGDVDNTGDASTDLFQIRFYYSDGKNFQDKVLNQGGFLNAYQLQLLLNQTGPKTIETLFK